MKKIYFLTLAEVNEIHADQIKHYGGLASMRDINLLSSAVAMPYASYFSRIDTFVLLCTFLVFTALGLAITTSRLESKDRKALPVKIERISRVVYLVVFACIIVYSFLL